jgi:hypothetical protein
MLLLFTCPFQAKDTKQRKLGQLALKFVFLCTSIDNELSDLASSVSSSFIFEIIPVLISENELIISSLCDAISSIRVWCEVRTFVADNTSNVCSSCITTIAQIHHLALLKEDAHCSSLETTIQHATEALLFCCKLDKTIPALIFESSEKGFSVVADHTFLGNVLLSLYAERCKVSKRSATTVRLSNLIVTVCGFSKMQPPQETIKNFPPQIKGQLFDLLPVLLVDKDK